MASNICILWDWNGTLLDDLDAEVAALNAMLRRRGRPPVTREFFRRHFAFPARDFYRLVGMDVPDHEWDALAIEYHDSYHREAYALNRGAFAALELAKASGARQSILSALHQRLLEEETARFGVRRYMEHVCGTDNYDGGSKLARARELVGRLGGAADVVLIGDSIHDREVADAIGARCVLYSGGSHARSRLEGLAPIGNTLEDCVRLANCLLDRDLL